MLAVQRNIQEANNTPPAVRSPRNRASAPRLEMIVLAGGSAGEGGWTPSVGPSSLHCSLVQSSRKELTPCVHFELPPDTTQPVTQPSSFSNRSAPALLFQALAEGGTGGPSQSKRSSAIVPPNPADGRSGLFDRPCSGRRNISASSTDLSAPCACCAWPGVECRRLWSKLALWGVDKDPWTRPGPEWLPGPPHREPTPVRAPGDDVGAAGR